MNFYLKINCRTATVITEENCILGVIDKINYDIFLKELSERIKKQHIHSILSSPLFYGIKIANFESTFYNDFVFMKIFRGNVLIQQNIINNDVYLLKEGEYEITLNISLNDLSKLITYLGGNIRCDYIELKLIKGKL